MNERLRIFDAMEGPILEKLNETLLKEGFSVEEAQDATERIRNSGALDSFVENRIKKGQIIEDESDKIADRTHREAWDEQHQEGET